MDVVESWDCTRTAWLFVRDFQHTQKSGSRDSNIFLVQVKEFVEKPFCFNIFSLWIVILFLGCSLKFDEPGFELAPNFFVCRLFGVVIKQAGRWRIQLGALQFRFKRDRAEALQDAGP